METFDFGARITSFRKSIGLTQEGLARQLGVTNQAVSKWESGKARPDITLLPLIASLFGCSIDELFGRTPPARSNSGAWDNSRLPWPDDSSLYAVCYRGHQLISYTDTEQRDQTVSRFHRVLTRARPVELHVYGEAETVHSVFSVSLTGATVHGDIRAGRNVVCDETRIDGNVTAGGSVSCGPVGGSITTEGRVTVIQKGPEETDWNEDVSKWLLDGNDV